MQIQFLDGLEKLGVTAEESITIPSVFSIFYSERGGEEFDQEAYNSMRNVKFILQLEGGDSIEIPGEIASVWLYLRGHVNFETHQDGFGKEKNITDITPKVDENAASTKIVPITHIAITDFISVATLKNVTYLINLLQRLCGLDFEHALDNLSGWSMRNFWIWLPLLICCKYNFLLDY